MVNEVLGNDQSSGVNCEFEAMPLGNCFSFFFLASLVLVMMAHKIYSKCCAQLNTGIETGLGWL